MINERKIVKKNKRRIIPDFLTSSIQRKISSGFTIVIVLVLSILLISYFQLKNVRSSTEQIIPNSIQMNLNQNIALHISSLDSNIERFFIIGGVQIQEDIFHYLEHISENLESMKKQDNERMIPIIKELENIVAGLRKDILNIIETEITNLSSREINEKIISIYSKIKDAKQLHRELTTKILTQLHDTVKEQESITNNMIFHFVTLGILVFLLAISASLLLAKIISKPIVELRDASNEVGEGKLDTQIQIESNDEIGQLAFSFNRMVENIRQSGKELHESEEKYRTLIETMEEGILIVDENENFTFINQAAANMFGYPKEELLGKNLKKFTTPEEFQRVLEQTSIRKTDKTSKYELSIIRKDGEQRIIALTATPKFDDNGKFRGTLGIFHDITIQRQSEDELKKKTDQLISNQKELEKHYADSEVSRKSLLSILEDVVEKEKDLRESEEKFRILVQHSPLGIFKIDIKGNIEVVNPSLLKLLGSPSEEETRKINLLTFPLLVKSGISGFVKECIKKGKSISGEFLYRSKWGKEVSINLFLTPVQNNLKQVVGVQGIIEDITQRKLAENAIKESEAKYRLLAENTLDCIWKMDKDLKFTYINQSIFPMLGFTREEWTGTKLAGHCSKKELQHFMNIVEDELRKEETYSAIFEMNLFHKDGREIPLEILGKILLDENKKITGFQGNARDITERKKAEELQTTIYNISNAVNISKDLDEFFETIHTQLSNIINTTNFYIALYDKENDTISLPYHVDKKDRFKTFPAGKTITSYVIKGGKSLLATDKVFKKLEKAGEVELIGTPSKIWLGVPLKVEAEVIGVAAVQSYTDDITYTDNDMKILEFVSDQVAVAIDRKKKGEQIKKDLEEKIVMLMEIHHRVKNNMQVISSMLKMQSGYIRDEQDRQLFKDSLNRVKSMALIHEKLYQTKDLANIDFSEYVRSLAMHLFSTFGLDTYVVKLNTNIKDVFLDINTAIPCGLIINELISNSLKYAFLEGKEGIITINLAGKKSTENKKEKIYTLVVSDNGVGFPADVDFRNTESLGLQLVNTLVDQLHGDIKLYRRGGTSFKIVFKRSELKKRSRFY